MPCDFHLLPHAGIRTLKPYIPGKSADELRNQRGDGTPIIKLASNENPLGCSPLVTEVLAKLSPSQIAAYTISAIHPLNKKITDQLALEAGMVILGNGSDLLFTLLLTCFALHNDKHMMTHDLAFISYSIQAHTFGIPVVSTPLKNNWQVDIPAMVSRCTEKTALIFIANPNNPTGLLIPAADIEYLLKNIPTTTILVLDEAYYEYVNETDRLNTLSLLAHYPNLVITRTFSKAYGLAGLRLGYAIACTPIIDILHRAQLPFTVNRGVLEAASAALEDTEFLKLSITNTVNGLKQLQQGLERLGLSYLPSSGNFITFDCKIDTGPLYQALLQRGIILRPLHPYGLNHYFRVSVGTQQQNSLFLSIFEELYNEK